MAYPNRYQSWTPRLLKAAYNYQFGAKEPGIHAHNPRYARQILIDSLDDLGTAVPSVAGGYARPLRLSARCLPNPRQVTIQKPRWRAFPGIGRSRPALRPAAGPRSSGDRATAS